MSQPLIYEAFNPARYAPTSLAPTTDIFRNDNSTRNTSIVQPDPALNITPVPLPDRVLLDAPKYEKEVYNNCGAATLTMILRMYGWEGNQDDISSIIKPNVDDKNVNIDELVYYVRNYAGWLNADFRVAGDIT